jgi:hypothetical protein
LAESGVMTEAQHCPDERIFPSGNPRHLAREKSKVFRRHVLHVVGNDGRRESDEPGFFLRLKRQCDGRHQLLADEYSAGARHFRIISGSNCSSLRTIASSAARLAAKYVAVIARLRSQRDCGLMCIRLTGSSMFQNLKRSIIYSLFSLVVVSPDANAQEGVKSCPSVEVRSINESGRPVRNLPLDTKQETIETGVSKAEAQDVTIVARGPVLGSMDSEKLSTALACTRDGFVLTATITRSANYHGAVRQNVLWSPEIIIVIVPRQPAVVAQTIWKMRLSNGKELGRARTPPYLQQDYPITVTQTVHTRSQ